VARRGTWGYEELKALIRFSGREGLDPATIKGSYAGAMGIPQFMPSNALTLARDGSKDGKVDLFDHQDAIFSVANYLKHHGWKPGISRQRSTRFSSATTAATTTWTPCSRCLTN
jgi:membrane-bound lytic murein transglycosylase B